MKRLKNTTTVVLNIIGRRSKMEENFLREFRGYVGGELKYTFPLHWMDHVMVDANGKMVVRFEDETQYDTENEDSVFETILVDEISIK